MTHSKPVPFSKEQTKVIDDNATTDKVVDNDSFIPVDEHVEEVSEGGKKVRHKGVYLLPNLFTTGALFSGFYAIVISMSGSFEAAAIAIFVAMILDGLDGRVARLTNTTSEFGMQYDSLADMVSFGIAPAIVVLNWGLLPLGKLAWAASFGYVACAALRLARFNTQTAYTDKRFFIGLASPASAAVIAAVVWAWHDVSISLPITIVSACLTMFLGLLMVSNFKYNSFKGLDFKGRVPFVGMLIVILLFVLVTSNPPIMLLFILTVYSLSGPIMWLVSIINKPSVK